MSESSLGLLVYPHFELDNEQAKDKICKALLIKQGTEQIEWFCWFILIPLNFTTSKKLKIISENSSLGWCDEE